MTGRTEEDSFYNDLDLSFDKAWKLIEPGANNRTSSAHTPVVGTVDNEGFPQLRVIVLREADRNKRLLRFHTDVRSQKVEEIAANNLASVLMYDAAQKLQLRLLGIARVSDVPADTENAWTTSTTFARRCYLAESAPGSESSLPTSGLPEWIEGKQPVEEQLVAAREILRYCGLKLPLSSCCILQIAVIGVPGGNGKTQQMRGQGAGLSPETQRSR